jgi:hypothetical protein
MNVRILISAMLCFLLIGYGVKLQAEPTESLPVEAGVIRGKVIDAKTREPMQFVNISVRKAGTTVPLKGMVTDETGTFHIAQLPEGSYTLSISFIGYKTIEKPFTLSKQIPGVNFRNLLLQEDSQLLGEVKVTGQRSQMKFDIDKKVFNVDQNISSTGGTASDVLTNIPSVEVDNEGEVSLRGSSDVTVWINGRASGLSADNRAQILEQLPAESIERIEVITNPSAKFSPEGTSGIINIVLKEDRRAGYYSRRRCGDDQERRELACKPESTPAAAGMPVAMSTTAVIKRRCMPEWATGNGKETAVVSPIGPIRMLRVIRSLSSIRLPTMTAMADKLSSVPA